MLLLDDDLEDSPWMVLGSLQYAAAGDLFQSLRNYARRHQRPWFVAGMLPILYLWPGYPRKRQLAPDIFVAFGPDRSRPSYDVEVEGGFPSFVLEVVSPSSADRDQTEKRVAYDQLGAREYALFNPFDNRPSELFGYRRSAAGTFEPWPADDQGRLWSDVLGLYLVAQGATVRAATREGDLLPTLSEAVAAQERDALARREAVVALERELLARREADQEIDRLRRENDQLRRQAKGE